MLKIIDADVDLQICRKFGPSTGPALRLVKVQAMSERT